MATNEADALVAAWCAALPYPAEDLVGTANDAWAVPQTSQTALGSSVAASLSTLSADAAEAALPRWHDASLAAAATTYCVDAAAALDGVYRAREAALHARHALEAAATGAAAARTNGEPETGRGLAAEALARADAARAAARAVELSVEACCGTLAALAKEEDASLGEAPRRFARAARAAVEAIAVRADDRAAACLKDASVLEGLVDRAPAEAPESLDKWALDEEEKRRDARAVRAARAARRAALQREAADARAVIDARCHDALARRDRPAYLEAAAALAACDAAAADADLAECRTVAAVAATESKDARAAADAGAAADAQRLDTAAQAAAKVLSEGGRLTLLKKTAKVLRASSGLTERLGRLASVVAQGVCEALNAARKDHLALNDAADAMTAVLAAHAVGAFDPRDRRVEAQRAQQALEAAIAGVAAAQGTERDAAAARLSEAKAAFQAKRGADLAAADAVLGVEARDTRAGAWPPAPPETDGDALLLRCRADALTNAAHAVRTADPAAADCADRRQKLDAALQRHALVVGDADPPTVDVAYHCALDLLVRGRAVEPSLAAPQEEPTAPAPKHLEPTRAPAAALGDATNVVH